MFKQLGIVKDDHSVDLEHDRAFRLPHEVYDNYTKILQKEKSCEEGLEDGKKLHDRKGRDSFYAEGMQLDGIGDPLVFDIRLVAVSAHPGSDPIEIISNW